MSTCDCECWLVTTTSRARQSEKRTGLRSAIEWVQGERTCSTCSHHQPGHPSQPDHPDQLDQHSQHGQCKQRDQDNATDQIHCSSLKRLQLQVTPEGAYHFSKSWLYLVEPAWLRYSFPEVQIRKDIEIGLTLPPHNWWYPFGIILGKSWWRSLLLRYESTLYHYEN